MGKTMIQKIFENHSDQEAKVGDIIDIAIDVRVADIDLSVLAWQ